MFMCDTTIRFQIIFMKHTFKKYNHLKVVTQDILGDVFVVKKHVLQTLSTPGADSIVLVGFITMNQLLTPRAFFSAYVYTIISIIILYTHFNTHLNKTPKVSELFLRVF